MRHFAIASLVGCLICTGLSAGAANGDVRFDETRWKAAQVGSAASVRLKMLDDLVSSHHLSGLARDAVHSLLGAPMPYELAPDDEDWYVVEERYHDESNQFEEPYLQRHLIIKYARNARSPSMLYIETTTDVPGTKKVKVSRVPLK